MSSASINRLGVLALALLGGCQREPAEPVPTPSVSASSQRPPTEKPSIIRPEVESERLSEKPLVPLTLRIGFPDGGASLSSAAVAKLEQALASKPMEAGGAITVAGHSDSAGGDAANLAASRKRAEAVRDWLVKHGVAEDRITMIAFGEQNPVAPNALANGEPDPAGRAANRRVELTIAVPESAQPIGRADANGTLVDELASDD